MNMASQVYDGGVCFSLCVIKSLLPSFAVPMSSLGPWPSFPSRSIIGLGVAVLNGSILPMDWFLKLCSTFLPSVQAEISPIDNFYAWRPDAFVLSNADRCNFTVMFYVK